MSSGLTRFVTVLVLGLLVGLGGPAAVAKGSAKSTAKSATSRKSSTSGNRRASPPPREEMGADYVTEKRSDGTTVKYKKKTSYDFEGLGVEAMADKPSGSYISNIKDVKARTLIQIRKDFDAEVIETSRQMP